MSSRQIAALLIHRIGYAVALLLCGSVFFATRSIAAAPDTALLEYVTAPDASYNYTLAGPPQTGDGFTLYVVYMNSQHWRSTTEVDRTQWSHWMALIVPDTVSTDTAMLFIAGGDNGVGPQLDASEVALAAVLATHSRSVVTVLGQIPNQPLFFADEPFAHSEDTLVAYSWDRAMNRLDWQWPAYLPMTKASMRAMDTVQAVATAVAPVPINQFVLTGYSKRGAATWLTGAMDPRVRAIAPGVFDALDIDKQIEHHFEAYGFYSNALDSYANYNLLRRLRTPEGQDLLKVVDPLSYRDRLTMPKYILVSTGDPFFLPDASQFYLDQLPGENRIRYVANSDHGLDTTGTGDVSDALYGLLGWYLDILYDQPRPQINWRVQDGKLIVTTDQPPALVRFWQANNPAGRDFRVDTINRTWSYVPLVASAPGSYSADIPTPPQGWTAYYIDLIYPGVAGVPQTYSTSVYVSPDTLPFTVTDPLGKPRGMGYWKHQVNAAVDQKKSQLPATTLAGYFPLPLFDQSIADIYAAAAIFNADEHDAAARARMHCLAMRLNVRDGQLGWYTPLTNTDNHEQRLWQVYALAHAAFMAGNAKQAQQICADINDK